VLTHRVDAVNPGRYIPIGAKDQLADATLEDRCLEIVSVAYIDIHGEPTPPSRSKALMRYSGRLTTTGGCAKV